MGAPLRQGARRRCGAQAMRASQQHEMANADPEQIANLQADDNCDRDQGVGGPAGIRARKSADKCEQQRDHDGWNEDQNFEALSKGNADEKAEDGGC